MSGNLSTASSGHTSVPTSAALSPGTSSSVAVASSVYAAEASALGSRYAELVAGKPRHHPGIALAGDVFFHCKDNKVGHSNMVSNDLTKKVDSVDTVGVRILPLAKDTARAVVFRFADAEVARKAALLAQDWANSYDTETRKHGHDGVGYAGGPTAGIGVTGRSVGALLGSCKFGTGARARLEKYRDRPGNAPRHVICSEMCVLAYQLVMKEGDDGFIALDAKHTTPADLFRYFTTGGGKGHWTVFGYR